MVGKVAIFKAVIPIVTKICVRHPNAAVESTTSYTIYDAQNKYAMRMQQTLSDITGLLKAFGLRPKHRLGQNFLHDGNQMARVVEAAQLKQDDLVLEIGAGTGALTQRLLEAETRVVAVEVDRELEPILAQQLAAYGDQVTVVICDALAGKHAIHSDVIAALQAAGRGVRSGVDQAGAKGQFKLVANLPYNIASPLLVNLVSQEVGGLILSGAVVMVQREVADRLCALPGGKEYGPLGVMVAAMCRVEQVAVVGPGCFWPRPKVESAVVRLTRRDRPLTDDPEALSRTLHLLFSRRRKQIGGILGNRQGLPSGVDPHARPEQLSVEQLVAVSDWLKRN